MVMLIKGLHLPKKFSLYFRSRYLKQLRKKLKSWPMLVPFDDLAILAPSSIGKVMRLIRVLVSVDGDEEKKCKKKKDEQGMVGGVDEEITKEEYATFYKSR